MHSRQVFVGLLAAGSIILGANRLGAGQNRDSTQKVILPDLVVHPRENPWKTYRGSARRINDLIHTKLDVRFDYGRRFLYGKAWITLHPHFYPTDSLTLDAKWMDLRQVDLDLGGRLLPLHFTYDSMRLHIRLNRTYTRKEPYTIFISYVARPNDYERAHRGGSSAIIDDKGLYFINPLGKDPDKPTQIWTQGETQSNSVWFPTIDRPDQKTTEEISMTVPDKYVTLSNGLMVASHKNPDSTRTDTWRLDKPHCPYLFMMAVGDFTIIHDHYRKIPVDYYVEPAYARYARATFGHTPEMIAYFSRILNFPYPWPKYDQIVVRDYISGSMENTTATLHGEFLNKTSREILDNTYNYDEDVIAHELFHQWFGDLVTCESWSNITLNESFADFSEMLWAEHEYGRDLADAHSYNALQAYFETAARSGDHNLVRFHYTNREDVFDAVTYQKGGRILNMLRHYVGDSAFFKSLNLYLNRYKYQSAEAQELRLAFEDVTGEDLNWFWNEWYYGKGYPKLAIRYHYNDQAGRVRMIVTQQQNSPLFKLPVDVDIYSAGARKRYRIWVEDPIDTFTFAYRVHPNLVDFDAPKVLVARIDDSMSLEDRIFQFHHAPRYLDRREALKACAYLQDSLAAARNLLLDGLRDPFYGIRDYAMTLLDLQNARIRTLAIPRLEQIAGRDPVAVARAAALSELGKMKDPSFRNLFLQALNDSSYSVDGAGLSGLNLLDTSLAYRKAKPLEGDARDNLLTQICLVLAAHGHPSDLDYISNQMKQAGFFDKLRFVEPLFLALAHPDISGSDFRRSLNLIVAAATQYHNPNVDQFIARGLKGLARTKQEAASQAGDPHQTNSLKSQADFARKLSAGL